jgi:hypothetical protein
VRVGFRLKERLRVRVWDEVNVRFWVLVEAWTKEMKYLFPPHTTLKPYAVPKPWIRS